MESAVIVGTGGASFSCTGSILNTCPKRFSPSTSPLSTESSADDFLGLPIVRRARRPGISWIRAVIAAYSPTGLAPIHNRFDLPIRACYAPGNRSARFEQGVDLAGGDRHDAKLTGE